MSTTIQQGQAYDAIPRIAHALNRIANCLEAAEKRAQEKEDSFLEGECSFDGCNGRVIVMLNNEKFCARHIDEGFASLALAKAAVMRGFESIEDAAIPDLTDKERDDFTDALEENT